VGQPQLPCGKPHPRARWASRCGCQEERGLACGECWAGKVLRNLSRSRQVSQSCRSRQVRASWRPAAEEESLGWLLRAGFVLQLPRCCRGSSGACPSPAPVFTRRVGTSYLCSLGPLVESGWQPQVRTRSPGGIARTPCLLGKRDSKHQSPGRGERDPRRVALSARFVLLQ